MLPVLLHFGILKIYTFGVFLLLAFFWSSFVLWKLIRLTSFKEEQVFDTVFSSLFAGMIVGRLFHVFFHSADFGLNILKIILVNGYPGISLYGFLIGFIGTIYLVTLIKKISFSEMIDYIVPPLLIALAIEKVGAFFSGVDYGTITKFFFSVQYSGLKGFRHVTALYEAIVLLIVFYGAYRLLFEIRKEKLKHGFLFYLFVFFFSFLQLIVEPIKGKKDYLFGQNANGILSLILLLTTGIYFLYYFRITISERIKYIINLVLINGQKIFKSRIGKNPKKIGGGEKKTDPTN